MYWQYRTILFEYHKDGLLGDKYIDDEEVERVLNEQGEGGWELVTVTPVQEGLMSFLKHVQLQPAKHKVVKDAGGSEVKSGTISPPTGSVPAQNSGRYNDPVRPETQQKTNPPGQKKNKVGEIKIS